MIHHYSKAVYGNVAIFYLPYSFIMIRVTFSKKNKYEILHINILFSPYRQQVAYQQLFPCLPSPFSLFDEKCLLIIELHSSRWNLYTQLD